MTEIPLGGGAEFDRIRAIAAALGHRARELGSDTALVRLGGTTVALSADVSVEGVHFRREWLGLEEIGWRAAASALSDLAASGAEAIGVLAALTIPAQEPVKTFVSLMQGIGAAADAVGGKVLGGDLSRGDAISLALTVVGSANAPVKRSGAAPGDRVWVTGELGGARAALTAFIAGRVPDPGARIRFAHPEPRLEWGRWLAGHGAKAMLDVSDGLAGDAGHLAAASGVGIRIHLEKVPYHPSVAAEARLANEPPGVFATKGGEDFELLVVLPPGFRGASGFPLTQVGEVIAGAGLSLQLEGREVVLAGYEHFA
ncbi:MAG TPA: thiamine-phosphate kinase [Gemmatimonadales bacterium]|nr:thiamine-phosphate kinase [Gemmatimonadales bacterium]